MAGRRLRQFFTGRRGSQNGDRPSNEEDDATAQGEQQLSQVEQQLGQVGLDDQSSNDAPGAVGGPPIVPAGASSGNGAVAGGSGGAIGGDGVYTTSKEMYDNSTDYIVASLAEGMVPNEDQSGFSFQIELIKRLERFLILGTEGNTYYASEKDRTYENISCINELLEKGEVDKVLHILKTFSVQGRCPKEEPILVALVQCCYFQNAEIRKKAYDLVTPICNIPTKLFRFIELCQQNVNQERTAKKHLTELPKELKKNPLKQNPLKRKKEPMESEECIEEAPDSKKAKKQKKKNSPFKSYHTDKARSSGWGRMRRRGISSFYCDKNKSAERLLYLLTKFKNRNNWNHRQVLGYAHPKISKDDEEQDGKNLVLAYCTRGVEGFQKKLNEIKRRSANCLPQNVSRIQNFVQILEQVSKLSPENEGDEEKLLEFLRGYGIRESADEFAVEIVLPGVPLTPPPPSSGKEKAKNSKQPFQVVREHIPTAFLSSAKVWEALLQDMPMTAMLRNLGKMTSLGLFQKPENLKIVLDALGDTNRLQKARIHPIKLLIGMKAYENGASLSMMSSVTKTNTTTWEANQEILKILDKAFYKSFKQPETQDAFRTGKRFMLALDVSGSMTCGGCNGCEQLTPSIAATALSMVTWNIEEHVEMVAFGGRLERLEDHGLRKDLTINDAWRKMSRINFGSTDCALPMNYAIDRNLDIDVFIVYTDSDTNSYNHPHKALQRYREKMGKPNAKLIVIALTSNGFSIADPNDRHMLDVVGFDPAVPEMICNFVNDSY
uniref:TROVE domain-containing protein n=3 Tax=Clytia hemisphaerica TaxID=252671 RepID=A0A7M5V631_9CNID